ncbi:unnamed protein product [Meganyctiphanes norvegica]|uniref:Glycosyltransferase family 92 protein n=1 Tax=Meganyctiphanes norvegica TaxID=48144 RepID=A0AAV2REI1_MEGNR
MHTKYIDTIQHNMIDNTAELSEEELAKEIQKRNPNLPVQYWFKNRYAGMKYADHCAAFPSLLDVKYNNIYWQYLKTSQGTFYLYSAYYDNRYLVKNKPVIRILTMYDSLDINVTIHCQIWLNNRKTPVFSEVSQKLKIWDDRWGNNKEGVPRPYLLTCKIPSEIENELPEAVSLVHDAACIYAKTLLRVIDNRPENGGLKKGIAVCVKGLDYMHSDLSVQLVEWLELLSVVGADKVFMYVYEAHPNVTKVLQHYAKRGFLDVTPITLPGGQPNLKDLRHWFHKGRIMAKRQNELIPYNDCLYRNIHNYKFISLLDTDEIIMPKSATNWHELIEQLIDKSGGSTDSYYFRNVYFMDSMRELAGWAPGIPKYMHKTQNVYRSTVYTKQQEYIKCFHDTDRVETVHNHFSMSCLEGGCKWYPVHTDDGHLQHYRNECVAELKPKCDQFRNNITKDASIWRFKDQLVHRTVKTLKILGFLDDL